MRVEHSKSRPTDDELSLKGAWPLSRDLFNFWEISNNISKTVRDSLIVSINSNRKSYALYRMVMLLITLGDPNHLKPPHFLHFALPATSSLVIAKTSNLMYRLNVQVTAGPTGDKLCLIGAWSGHVTH